MESIRTIAASSTLVARTCTFDTDDKRRNDELRHNVDRDKPTYEPWLKIISRLEERSPSNENQDIHVEDSFESAYNSMYRSFMPGQEAGLDG